MTVAGRNPARPVDDSRRSTGAGRDASVRAAAGPDDAHTDTGVPSYSTGWIARRLGIAPATLRPWHRRYGVGPTSRTDGGHGRYLAGDLDRLTRMCRLMLTGVPTAEAARASADPGSAPPAEPRPAPPRRTPVTAAGRRGGQVSGLVEAATAWDQPAVESTLAAALRRDGVVPTWTELIVPVLRTLGDRYAAGGAGIAAEHMFTGCTRTALTTTVVTRRRRGDGHPPVLLACPDREQHSLPLHAVAAALAEIGCTSRILGASVPAGELAAAAPRIVPRAVFVWSHTPATARPADLRALRVCRPPVPVVVGGPGWEHRVPLVAAAHVNSLGAAVAALSRRVTPPVEAVAGPDVNGENRFTNGSSPRRAGRFTTVTPDPR